MSTISEISEVFRKAHWLSPGLNLSLECVRSPHHMKLPDRRERLLQRRYLPCPPPLCLSLWHLVLLSGSAVRVSNAECHAGTLASKP